MGYRGIPSQEELEELLAKGKYFKRRAPVRAVPLVHRILIEEPDGDIVTGNVGDYLIQNGDGDMRPWILPADYFERHFKELSEAEVRQFDRTKKKQAVPPDDKMGKEEETEILAP